MRFRDEFQLTGKTYAEWSLEKTMSTGLRANEDRLRVFQGIVKSTFEQGVARLVESQMADSDALRGELAYQAERIGQQIMQSSNEIVGAVERGSADIATSIQQMSDYLGSELCEVRWAVERLTHVSEKILRVLLESLSNESRQYFEQGVKCYETNEYDFAKERFSKALEANRTNHFVYEYLGFIGVREDKPDEAIRNFNLAYKFAETGYHQALALSHLARSYHAMGDLVKASDLAKTAADTHAETAKFWYEYSGYNSRLAHAEQAITALKKAIERDWTYWTVVACDTDFDSIRKYVNDLLCELREQERRRARQSIDELKGAIDTAEKVGVRYDLSEPQRTYYVLEEKYRQSNVFLYREIVPEAQEQHKTAFYFAELTVKERIVDKRKEIEHCEFEKKERIQELHEPITELKREKERIGTGYSEWHMWGDEASGFFIAVTLFVLPPVMIIMGGVFHGAGGSFGDGMLCGLIGVPILFLAVHFSINELRRYTKVTAPKQKIEERIEAQKDEVEFLKNKVEKKHRDLKMKLERELSNLEKLLEKCRARQYI